MQNKVWTVLGHVNRSYPYADHEEATWLVVTYTNKEQAEDHTKRLKGAFKGFRPDREKWREFKTPLDHRWNVDEHLKHFRDLRPTYLVVENLFVRHVDEFLEVT